MLRKILSLALTVYCTCACLNSIPAVQAKSLPEQGYKRIVIVSDAHYPSKSNRFTQPDIWQQKINRKVQAAKDINSWQDVNLVAFTGDIVALTGSEHDREQAKSYVDLFTKPKAILTGNHEFTYRDIRRANGKLVHASLTEQHAKLQAFQEEFGLKKLYRAQKMGPYELIFLSPEPVTGKHLCELSKRQLTWLDKKLSAHPDRPTIIFFHAPLTGTLAKDSKAGKAGNIYAEPHKKLAQILQQHAQIKLWVSGHTHTPPTNPSFASPRNYTHGILDVYNPTLDGKRIWTNSLYLYPDKIVIKTFDHQAQKFLDKFTRTVPVKSVDLSQAA